MMRPIEYRHLLYLYLGVIFFSFPQISFAQGVKIYHYPEQAPQNTQYQVSIGEQACFVYATPVAGMASFGATETVEVTVKPNFPFQKVDIRPKHLAIKHQIEGDIVKLSVPKNTKVFVEFDDRFYKPLYLFSQEPIENQTADIIYESGKYYKEGFQAIQSGQRVWVQAGAVVEGFFLMENVTDVHIFGHGIIDNSAISNADGTGLHGINWIKATNSSLKNIHLIGNPRWSTSFFACDNMLVDDVRIIGWRPSDDGIDIVGCQGFEVKNSFIRTKDDCIALKAMPFDVYWRTAPKEYQHTVPENIGCRDVKEIYIHDNTLWNAEWGNAIEIGFETQTDVMEKITIENIDVIRVEANGGVFTIHNGDRALIRDVLYKNIRIEEAYGYLCHFQILDSHYSKDKIRGNGRNIRFENITVTEGVALNSLITGLNENHTYEGIHFKNLYIHGKKINNQSEAGTYTEYTSHVTFE